VTIRGRTIASGVLCQADQGEDCHRKEDTQELALEREKAASDSNHVPTSVDAHTDDALKEWFEHKDIATGLQLSLNKNRMTELGSNFTDFKKLGFRDETALTKAHKSIDLKYLRKLNRMAGHLLHDAVFEPSIKVDTAAQTKLNGRCTTSTRA
jgi:hypothetical protein